MYYDLQKVCDSKTTEIAAIEKFVIYIYVRETTTFSSPFIFFFSSHIFLININFNFTSQPNLWCVLKRWMLDKEVSQTHLPQSTATLYISPSIILRICYFYCNTSHCIDDGRDALSLVYDDAVIYWSVCHIQTNCFHTLIHTFKILY